MVNKQTTMWTDTDTLNKLDHEKEAPTESYNDVVKKLLFEVKVLRDWRENQRGEG